VAAPFSPTLALLSASREAELRVAVVLEPLGLTLRKYGMLARLAETAGIAERELARASGVPAEDVAPLVRRMVTEGLVRSTGRPPQLSVTPHGAAVAGNAAHAIAQIDAELFESPERVELAASLRALQPEPQAAPED
jgi:DNA-binding MarR family transcriptional regulator